MKFYEITKKSFDELGVKSHKELWDKVQGDYKGLSMEVPVLFEEKTIKAEDGSETKALTMVFSTPDQDRHGDIVLQNFDLKWYKKNPVLLDSHNYDSITHIIGKVVNIRMEDDKLMGEIEFALMNPKGQLAQEMSKAGFINTSSIGFIPTAFSEEGYIASAELLENSLVSVPANARALFEKVADEVEKEIETFKKEIVEDVEIEKIAETKRIIDKKKDTLELITLALRELNKANRDEKKRLMFKALRSL
jgi:HK97 family phage prohead protease